MVVAEMVPSGAGPLRGNGSQGEKKIWEWAWAVGIIHGSLLGYPVERQFNPGAQRMSDTNKEELLSRKMMALFLIGGSLGAIIMSWIAYSAMIGRAM